MSPALGSCIRADKLYDIWCFEQHIACYIHIMFNAKGLTDKLKVIQDQECESHRNVNTQSTTSGTLYSISFTVHGM